MAKLKVKDIKNMDVKDIDEKIKELRKELIKLNGQIATGTVPKSPGEVRNIKKNIARMLTIKTIKLNEKKEAPKKASGNKKEGGRAKE